MIDRAGPHLRQLSTAARLAPIAPARAVEVQSPLVIRTARLVLRPIREEDVHEFVRVARLSREHLARFHPLHKGSETDEELFERQLSLSRAAISTGLACRLVAFDSSERMVGAFNLHDITSAVVRSAEVAYWLSAEATSRGYAREGLGGLLHEAMSPPPRGMGLAFVSALIAPENGRARAVALSVGFELDSRASRVHLNLGGRWQAHDPYVCTAPALLTRTAGSAGESSRAVRL